MAATGTFLWEASGPASNSKRMYPFTLASLFLALNAAKSRLSSSTGKPASSAVTSLATRTADSGAIEASVIYKSGSFYYLFSSWDLCCKGTSSTYNIRVGRATNVAGPYVDQSGVNLLNGGGTLVLAAHDNVRVCACSCGLGLTYCS